MYEPGVASVETIRKLNGCDAEFKLEYKATHVHNEQFNATKHNSCKR